MLPHRQSLEEGLLKFSFMNQVDTSQPPAFYELPYEPPYEPS